MGNANESNEPTKQPDSPSVRYDLLSLTQAYNRHEISYEEWLKQTKEWADAIIRRYGNGRDCHPP